MELLLQFLVYGGMVVCFFTIVFGLYPGRSSDIDTVEVRRLVSILFCMLLFFSVVIWLNLLLYLVAGHVFKLSEIQSNMISVLLSVLLSLCFAFKVGSRLSRGLGTRRYIRDNVLASAALVLTWLAASYCIHLSNIDGETPEAAAESVLKNHPEVLSLYGTLVEVNPDPDCEIKVFEVMCEGESCGMIDVQRYRKYWRARELFPITLTGAMRLRLAKNVLKDPANRQQGILDLRRIVMLYPGSPAAKEAQGLLTPLEDSAPSRGTK